MSAGRLARGRVCCVARCRTFFTNREKGNTMVLDSYVEALDSGDVLDSLAIIEN